METSNATLILKDVHEIYSRLFNHHPAISAEIQYLLREFDEERNDREVGWLFNLLEKATEMNETQVDKVKTQAQIHLPSLSSDFNKALDLSEKVLNASEEMSCQCEKSLNEFRQSRMLEWTNFMTDISKQKEKIDKAYDEKDDELRNYIQNLEEKHGLETQVRTPKTSPECD